MLFAKIKTADGHTESNLYFCWDAFHADTFSPDSDILFVLPFKIRGKTYWERKESLRDLAIDYQYNNDGDTDIQLSLGELADASDFFLINSKKYGLLREFRENCIC